MLRIIFTQALYKPFSLFCQDHLKNQKACEAGEQNSKEAVAEHMEELVDYAKEKEIKVIFV